jgi:hypothetical protein
VECCDTFVHTNGYKHRGVATLLVQTQQVGEIVVSVDKTSPRCELRNMLVETNGTLGITHLCSAVRAQPVEFTNEVETDEETLDNVPLVQQMVPTSPARNERATSSSAMHSLSR